MSILIKGVEIPKCCDECFALDEHGDYPYCLISKDQRGYTFNTREKRMPSCPIIDIPNGHGRLIDADALLDKQVADAKIFEGSTLYGDKVRYDEATNAVANIINAPTIIPSDKDGEE